MAERLYIQRGLQDNAVRQLAFRTQVHRFKDIGSLDMRPDQSLACAILRQGDAPTQLHDLTAAFREAPDATREPLVANVVDVIGIGRNRQLGALSYALALDPNSQLQADYNFFMSRLQNKAFFDDQPFLPHVTVLKTTGATPEAEKKLLEFVEQRSPAQIALRGIAAKYHEPQKNGFEELSA